MAALNVADLSAEQREIWQAEQTIWPQGAVRDSRQLRTRFERDPKAAYELDFHSIEVHGDAAIVYYTIVVTSRVAPLNGAPTKRRAGITHIWIKDGGVWQLELRQSRSPG